MIDVTITITDEQEAILTKLGVSADPLIPSLTAEEYFRARVADVLSSYTFTEDKKVSASVEDAFLKASTKTKDDIKALLGLAASLEAKAEESKK